MLFFPQSFERPNYELFKAHAMLWTIGCIFIGTMRIAALIINGHWNGGTPIIRMLGATFGAGVFGALVGTLLQITTLVSVPFALPAYIGLMIGEIIGSVNAASDIISLNRK